MAWHLDFKPKKQHSLDSIHNLYIRPKDNYSGTDGGIGFTDIQKKSEGCQVGAYNVYNTSDMIYKSFGFSHADSPIPSDVTQGGEFCGEE